MEKAKAAAEQTGMFTLGDDSGVYITAMDYFPGVHSRRWTGSESDDRIRNMKIIGYMKDEENREAFLISRFSLVSPDGEELFKTVVKNKFYIADRLIGDKGFGYDSILIPNPDYVVSAYNHKKITWERATEIISNKLTIAELSQYEKNVINYRGRIANEIRRFLDSVRNK